MHCHELFRYFQIYEDPKHSRESKKSKTEDIERKSNQPLGLFGGTKKPAPKELSQKKKLQKIDDSFDLDSDEILTRATGKRLAREDGYAIGMSPMAAGWSDPYSGEEVQESNADEWLTTNFRTSILIMNSWVFSASSVPVLSAVFPTLLLVSLLPFFLFSFISKES